MSSLEEDPFRRPALRSPTHPAYRDIESEVRHQALELGALERERDVEYIRLVALGESTYLAGRKADIEYGLRIRQVQASYEIALARLRR